MVCAQGSTFEGLNYDPIFQVHIRCDLAEDTRSPDGQLDIYTYAAVAEDEFVRRDSPRMRKKCGSWSVELPAAFIVVFPSRFKILKGRTILYILLTRDEKKDVQHDVYRAPLDLYPLALLT